MTDYIDEAESAFWAEALEEYKERRHRRQMEKEYRETGYWPQEDADNGLSTS